VGGGDGEEEFFFVSAGVKRRFRDAKEGSTYPKVKKSQKKSNKKQ